LFTEQDGVHPNKTGYRAIVALVAKELPKPKVGQRNLAITCHRRNRRLVLQTTKLS
jgi:hypothetical protein